jgi:hypothetical protein
VHADVRGMDVAHVELAAPLAANPVHQLVVTHGVRQTPQLHSRRPAEQSVGPRQTSNSLLPADVVVIVPPGLVAPAEPVKFVSPAEPVVPADPIVPAAPAVPAAPVLPAESVVPPVPVTPAKPVPPPEPVAARSSGTRPHVSVAREQTSVIHRVAGERTGRPGAILAPRR